MIPKPDTMHKPITPGRTAAPAPPAPSTRPGARVGKGHVALSSKRSSPRPSFDASSTASAMDAPAGEATPSRVLVVGGGRVGAYLAKVLRDGGVEHVVLKMSNRSAGARAQANGKIQDAEDPTRAGARAIATHAGATCVTTYDDLPTTLDAAIDRPITHFDFVFVAVKTYAFESVRAEMEASQISYDVIVLAHNGMCAPVFDASKSARASMPQSWDIFPTPGEGCGYGMHVRNEDKPWVLPDTPHGRAAKRLLDTCGVKAVASPEFEFLVLQKYFINGVANLLAVIGDVDCDGLLANDTLRTRMGRLYDEMYSALKQPHREGIAMAPDNFRDVVFQWVASYGAHYPSSKQDFDAGARLEIESLNGYVVRLAESQGLPCPENKKVLEEVRSMIEARDAKAKQAVSAR